MFFFFFFKAEDGIRDKLVTGVQTCALPICTGDRRSHGGSRAADRRRAIGVVRKLRGGDGLIDSRMFVPTKAFLTKGVGRHKEKLTSFEMSLRDAHLANFNLVRVSSIFPPHCELM